MKRIFVEDYKYTKRLLTIYETEITVITTDYMKGETTE